MADPRKRPTAVDVARESGVSTATVSYVLNDTPGQTIPAATRDRVLAAADQLGYVPSAYAQALARGRSRVVVVDLSEIPHGEAIARHGREIAAALDARGYLPIVDQPERSSGSSHDRLIALASMLAPTMVISATPLPKAVRDRLTAAGVRHLVSLLAGEGGIEERVDTAAHAQVAYLASRNHRTIAYCGTDESHLAAFDTLRRTAVAAEARLHGIRLIDLGSHGHPASLAAAIASARASHPELSAIAAYNDEVAFAALSAAHRLRLDVPGQLAVIGIDDTPLARSSHPTLTSVGLSDGGRRTTDDYLDEILAADHSYRPLELVARIAERESA